MSDEQPTKRVDQENEEDGGDDKAPEEEAQVEFKPLVQLNEVEVKTMEENEDTLFSTRAKLFRYENTSKEWKERGVGVLKILQLKDDKSKIRVLMRRDKTLKICANHYITEAMALKPNVGSDRSWVYNTLSDFSEEEVKPETFAVRFQSPEEATKFKSKFEEAQQIVKDKKPEKKEEEEKKDA